MTEFEIIERFFARAAALDGARADAQDVPLGIGDDAALIRVPPDADLVASVDSLVGGAHFLADADPHSVGHRALAVNLSDMAAMGATPAWALLALTLERAEERWLAEFSRGWFELARRYRVALVGGNTTRGPVSVHVQILGHVPHGAALRRDGARAGHLLVVSGSLGDAGAGFEIARSTRARDTLAASERTLLRRFEYPSARVELGLAARGIAAAAMDLSDGLAGDLPKLAAASGVSAHVDVEHVPQSSALLAYAEASQARDWALGAGDDYELLMAVAADRLAELEQAARRLRLPLAVIGRFAEGSGVTWSIRGEPFEPRLKGYDHFRCVPGT